MDYAYRADTWQVLYAAVAGSAAALTGLLFIALSLNLRTIIKTPEHTARARETFGGLLGLLVLSVLLLVPGQDRRVLGTELLIGSTALASIAVRLNIQTVRRLAPAKRVRWVLRISLMHLGTVAIIVAGISLIIGQFGGLFWLIPTVLIYLVWSFLNAWLLVVQIAAQES